MGATLFPPRVMTDDEDSFVTEEDEKIAFLAPCVLHDCCRAAILAACRRDPDFDTGAVLGRLGEVSLGVSASARMSS